MVQKHPFLEDHRTTKILDFPVFHPVTTRQWKLKFGGSEHVGKTLERPGFFWPQDAGFFVGKAIITKHFEEWVLPVMWVKQ